MKSDKIVVFVLIVLAVLLINSMGYINIPGLQAAGGDVVDKGTTGEGTGTLCLHDGSVMTVGPVSKRYAPTTSATSEYHRVFIDGIDRGLKIDGTTMDVTTPTRIGGTDGSNVEIFYAANSTNYYAAKQAFSVPCISSFSSGARPDSDAYKIVANATSATVTVSVFNDDDATKMSTADSTNNESISASDSANLDIKINWPSKSGYSPYGKVYLTARYNTTTIQASKLDLSSNDVTVSDGTTPQFRVTANSASGYGLKTWTFPGYNSLTTLVQHFNLYVPSTTTDPVFGGSNITVYIDDEDYFRNTETGVMELGPETNEYSNVGDTSTISATIVIV